MRILLADQQMLFRDGIISIIEGSGQIMQLVAVADYAEAIIRLQNEEPYDVIVIESDLSGMAGGESILNIRSIQPTANIAIISAFFTRERVRELTALKNISLIPKTLTAAQFIEVLKFIASGGLYQPIDIVKLVTDEFSDLLSNTSNNKPLTPRECDVLSQLGDGHSNKQIAFNLKIQDVTVRLHLRGIFRKLNAKNRVHAVLRAIELGLLHHHQTAATADKTSSFDVMEYEADQADLKVN